MPGTIRSSIVLLASLCSIGYATAESYQETYSVVTVAEDEIQSEACTQATLENQKLADLEFSNSVYMLINSRKSLTYTDTGTFQCEVTVLWGTVGSDKTQITSNTIASENEDMNEPASVPDQKKGHLALELSQTFSFQTSKNYKSTHGQTLTLSYLTRNNLRYRLHFLRSRINYKFKENSKEEETKPFEGIGIGFGVPLVKRGALEFGATLDVIESFPFSKTLTTDFDGEIIEQNIKGVDYVSISLPLYYQWNGILVSGKLTRHLYATDKKLHPYNYSLGIGYIW